jgi:threonine/homoserine/homoserine lactone efflux protein
MSGSLLTFILQAVAVSLSGVIAPGPVTAATLAAGTRRRHAGALIAVGHGIVEFPLMLLIMAGTSTLFASKGVTIGIGLVGGAFLILMGAQMLRGLSKNQDQTGAHAARNPILTGVILTGGNPYFLLWWVTVGLALATRALALGALAFGALAFGLFAIVHWLCDLVWLEALSLASFKGTRLLGQRSQRVVLAVCSAALILIGLAFILDASKSWALSRANSY